MSRCALFCFLGRGHLDPGLALGRGLQARGHDVVVFHISVAQAAVRSAGLSFVALDRHERDAGTPLSAGCRRTWEPTVTAVLRHAERTLSEGLSALRESRVDFVVADQLDVAAGSLAERLDLPFVSVSCGPPVFLDDSVPPPYFGWAVASGPSARARNRRANRFLERRACPILNVVNAARRRWGLPPIEGVNQLFSARGIVTQLPAALELPRVAPPHLLYAGPFCDDRIGTTVRFDWARLDGRPLVFASMGTVRNTSPAMFRTIADGCSRMDVQLVLSLGGGLLRPGDLGALPGDAIVVHYAPQRALLERASLTINCAGLNTTLDSLAKGVPLVVLPVAEDQPGVAARIAHAGVGVVIPAARVTPARLRDAVVAALNDASYRDRARAMERHLARMDGREIAVDFIEHVVRGAATANACRAWTVAPRDVAAG